MKILTDAEIEDKFWSHVLKSKSCWIWTLSLNHGYGQIWINGKRWIASRLAWVLTNGPIESAKMLVCHTCDNRACVRPDHLFIGDDSDNLRDMREKGRNSPLPHHRGSKNNKAKLTEHEVREIRSRYASGESLRTLGRIYHVDYTHISSIVRRRVWSHLT